MPEKTTASEVSLGAETVKATAAKFSMAAIGFVGTIIFARMLGPQKFGAYYLLFALVKIADLPIEGWSMAAKKRFSEQGAQISEIVGGQFVFVFAWIALGTLVALLTGSYIVSYTGVAVAVPLFIALLGGEAVYVSAERLLQSRGLVGKATWIDALRSYVTFGLQLALVLAGWGLPGWPMASPLRVSSWHHSLSTSLVFVPKYRPVRRSQASGNTHDIASSARCSGVFMSDSTSSFLAISLVRQQQGGTRLRTNSSLLRNLSLRLLVVG
ncbi:lipopolysaccharide biosynthesis protein [Halospeciosus flavus]|uniref:lipopolysaccharide biosynthesis protein n=1 Tax=Halospeciosus flavus TaxID=3032283 RepID=UPI003609D405